MARNEFGEVELVLGTKQLVGVFLVMVMLLAVFASMGYIVGRSSSPAAEQAKNSTPAKPIVVAKPTDQDASATAAASPASGDENKDDTASTASKPLPAPAAEPSVAPPVVEQKPKPSPIEKHAEEKAVEKPLAAKPAPKPAEKPSETARPAITQPSSGQYWQVMAAERPDAELIAEELSKKGLKTLLAPAPKEGYYRVLVGPFDNAARMAEIRTDLENAGFKHPIVRKY